MASLPFQIPGGGEGHEHNPPTMPDDQILEQINSIHAQSITEYAVGIMASLPSQIPGGGEGHEHNPPTMSDDQILEQINSTHAQSITEYAVGIMASLPSQIPSGGEGHEHNPPTMSDDQILEQINSTHAQSITEYAVGPLFSLVENTLTRFTHIVDSVVEGDSQVSLEHVGDKNTHANFSLPLCTLRQISSEMQCKRPDKQVAHKTTMAILGKLSEYEWDSKAVFTLAAFAMEYGEFWLLAQRQPNDLLVKSVAMLKGVPVLTKPAFLQKYRQAIVELNSLTKSILQVIKLIFELEQLSSDNTKDVPALVAATKHIPLDVYWATITIVAIVTQIDCLITESDPMQELSHYGQKIDIILSKLRNQITLCGQQIDVTRIYYKISKNIQTPTNVYLFVSTLDITGEDLSVVLEIDKAVKTKNQTEQYKIVWVLIVEEWTDQLRKRFQILGTTMPFSAVEHVGSVAGFKYMKTALKFKKKPMVVTMNYHGKILHHNAFDLIYSIGSKAFPFTATQDNFFYTSRRWVALIASEMDPKIGTWFEEEKYIFFYGGHDKDWVLRFNKYAAALANDDFLKEKQILIELFHVEKENENIFRRFWDGIESLFVTKISESAGEDDEVTKEVRKMVAQKNESGWALLSKGSEVILIEHGTTILKTVAEFEKWKEFVVTKGFEWSFKDYHENAAKGLHRCSHLEIPNVTGNLPERVRCPECAKTLEVYIT